MQSVCSQIADGIEEESCDARRSARPPTRPLACSRAPRSHGRFIVDSSTSTLSASKGEIADDAESVRSTDIDYGSVNDEEHFIDALHGTNSSDSEADSEDYHKESSDDETVASTEDPDDSSEAMSSASHPVFKDASDFDYVAAVAVVLEYLLCPGDVGTTVTKAFHSSQAPEVSLYEYLQRTRKYFKCSDCCIILGLVYVDRFLAKHANFFITNLTVHRLIFTSIVIATKFYEDSYYSNTFYAKVGGIRASELNSQEAELIRLLDWNLTVSPEDYDQYCDNLAMALPCEA